MISSPDVAPHTAAGWRIQGSTGHEESSFLVGLLMIAILTTTELYADMGLRRMEQLRDEMQRVTLGRSEIGSTIIRGPSAFWREYEIR